MLSLLNPIVHSYCAEAVYLGFSLDYSDVMYLEYWAISAPECGPYPAFRYRFGEWTGFQARYINTILPLKPEAQTYMSLLDVFDKNLSFYNAHDVKAKAYAARQELVFNHDMRVLWANSQLL